jgi:hypothetical protein
MALSGVHIVFGGCSSGMAVVDRETGENVPFPIALPFQDLASQTMISPAVSAITAPDLNSTSPRIGGSTLLSIDASAAIFYITGKNLTLGMLSNGVTPRRYYDPNNNYGREYVWVDVGDQFAWTFA